MILLDMLVLIHRLLQAQQCRQKYIEECRLEREVMHNWRASETLSGVTNGNRRYIYIYIYIYIWYVQDTLVARARCYVMWEELSVSHF